MDQEHYDVRRQRSANVIGIKLCNQSKYHVVADNLVISYQVNEQSIGLRQQSC